MNIVFMFRNNKCLWKLRKEIYFHLYSLECTNINHVLHVTGPATHGRVIVTCKLNCMLGV